MTRSRLLVPIAAVAAVLVVLGLVWWATSGDDGTTDHTTTQPTTEPSTPTSSATPSPELPDAIRVDSYFPRSETVLALNYAIGVPTCYGTVGAPEVTESADAVVVKLSRIAPKPQTDVACIDIALMKSIDVTLAQPLGDRVVKDGGFKDAPVAVGSDPYDGGTNDDPTY
jgi:hypothetical protein